MTTVNQIVKLRLNQLFAEVFLFTKTEKKIYIIQYSL